MNTADRRMEIINILIVRRHTTTRELAEEFGVTTRTIRHDIQVLCLHRFQSIRSRAGLAAFL